MGKKSKNEAVPRALIVGSTSGIGRALSAQMLNAGWIVGGVARNRQILEEMENEAQKRFYGQELDIKQIAEIPLRLEQLVQRMGGMDVCVVSSSITGKNKELEWSIEQNVLETNVLGYAAVLIWAARYFEKQGRGHLIGITSLAKYLGGRNPAYTASKAFEARYLDGLRLRLKRKGVLVTEVMPGFVNTPMIADQGRLFWTISAEKAANCIMRVVKKPKARVAISARWKPFRYLLPHLPDWLLGKFM